MEEMVIPMGSKVRVITPADLCFEGLLTKVDLENRYIWLRYVNGYVRGYRQYHPLMMFSPFEIDEFQLLCKPHEASYSKEVHGLMSHGGIRIIEGDDWPKVQYVKTRGKPGKTFQEKFIFRQQTVFMGPKCMFSILTYDYECEARQLNRKFLKPDGFYIKTYNNDLIDMTITEINEVPAKSEFNAAIAMETLQIEPENSKKFQKTAYDNLVAGDGLDERILDNQFDFGLKSADNSGEKY